MDVFILQNIPKEPTHVKLRAVARFSVLNGGPGDAKFGYHKERQGTKNLAVLAFSSLVVIPRPSQIQGHPKTFPGFLWA